MATGQGSTHTTKQWKVPLFLNPWNQKDKPSDNPQLTTSGNYTPLKVSKITAKMTTVKIFIVSYFLKEIKSKTLWIYFNQVPSFVFWKSNISGCKLSYPFHFWSWTNCRGKMLSLKFSKCVATSYHNLLLRLLGISYLTTRTFSLIQAFALPITLMFLAY